MTEALTDVLDRARAERWTKIALCHVGRSRSHLIRQGWDEKYIVTVADRSIDLGWLAGFTSLTQLAMPGLRIGPDGARAIASLTALTSLDLTFNGIGDEGARAIASLTALTSLHLGANNIWPGGARAIASLTALSSLDLGGNKIGDEGARAIASLTALSSLGLGYNKIGDQSARAIASLTALSSLDLGFNNIGPEGARAIAPLTALASLELGGNNIGPEGATAIASLIALTSLHLGGNDIGPDGARAIASLTALTSLHLGRNKIGDQGARAIASLTALSSLDLGYNNIGDQGARAIASLTALSSLDLGYNNIGPDGARAIASLTALTSLHLGGNNIGPDGARAIASLTSLSSLDLSGNYIEDQGARALLDRWLKAGVLPRGLFLGDNHITILAPEVLDSADAQAILAAYRRHKVSASKPLNEAKLLVIGSEAVGKTSLVRFLIHDKPRNPDEQKTPGIVAHERIETHRWDPDQQSGPRLNVWDFGGQEVMHETHKFFLTERSIYLLVLEDRREDDTSIYKWLRTIANRGGDSPVIVVINKCDDGQPKLLLDETTLASEWRSIAWVVRTSCNDSELARGSIARLRSKILELLGQDPRLAHVRDPIPVPWQQVKDRLTELAKREKVLGQLEFIRLCLALEGTEAITDEHEQRALLRLLHDLGVIVAYGPGHDAPAALQNVRLLDPNWLTGAIYKVLNSGLVVQQGGVFRRPQLAELLDPTDYPPSRWEFIVSMMQLEGVGLCFPLPNSTAEGYLVPEALPTNAPAHDLPKDSLRFRFEYELLPRGLIPRFLVEAHPRLTSTRWRTGAVLVAVGCQVLVKGHADRARIDIWVYGPEPMRRSALNVIVEDLQRVHALNPEARPTAKVPLPDNPEVDVSYDHLLMLEQRKGPSYKLIPDGAEREYRVSELLDGVRTRDRRGVDEPKRTSSRALARISQADVAAAEFDAEQKQLAVRQTRTNLVAAVLGVIAAILAIVLAIVSAG
jgi:internalin A